jgi:fatty-acid desaturase
MPPRPQVISRGRLCFTIAIECIARGLHNFHHSLNS